MKTCCYSALLAAVLFALPTASAAGQDAAAVDSLTRALGAAQTDSARVRVLVDLASAFAYPDPERAAGYARRAVALADRSSSLLLRVEALTVLGDATSDLGDAADVYRRARALAQRLPDSDARAHHSVRLDVSLTAVLDMAGKSAEARRHAQRAFEGAQQMGDDRFLFEASTATALLDQQAGRYAEAFRHHALAHSAAERLKSRRGLTVSDRNVGDLYSQIGDYPKAIEHFRRALRTVSEDDFRIAGSVYLKLASVYREQGDAARALEAATRAAEHFEKLEYRQFQLQALIARAIAFEMSGQTSEAQTLYAQAERGAVSSSYTVEAVQAGTALAALLLEAGQPAAAAAAYERNAARAREATDSSATADALAGLARAETARGRTKAALSAAREAVRQATAASSQSALLEARAALADAHAAASHWQPAYAERLRYDAVRDTLHSAEVADAQAEAEVRHDVETLQQSEEEQRQRADAATQRAEIQALRMERQRAMLLGGGLGLLMLALLAGALFYTARLRKEANALLEERRQEIEVQKDEIEAQRDDLATLAAERETLLREVHHRVKNNFQIVSSLLALQTDDLEDGTPASEAALALARQFQSRVMAMALVHQKLYQTEGLSQLNAKAYIEDLTVFLMQTFCTGLVEHVVDAEPVPLSVDTAVPLGLILSELVCNACEHAFPDGRAGTVRIALHSAVPEGDGQPATVGDGRLVLTVADDGMGLPPDVDARQDASLGLSLVRDLARQLRGDVEIESRLGEGTRCTVTFQPARKRAGRAEALEG